MGSASSRESGSPYVHRRAKNQPDRPACFRAADRGRGDKAARAQRAHDEAERERNREVLVKHYDGREEKGKLRAKYEEEVARKRREICGRQVVGGGDGDGGRGERGGRKGRERKEGEEIRVYASPDLKSKWSLELR